jgi:hypothetical protein
MMQTSPGTVAFGDMILFVLETTWNTGAEALNPVSRTTAPRQFYDACGMAVSSGRFLRRAQNSAPNNMPPTASTTGRLWPIGGAGTATPVIKVSGPVPKLKTAPVIDVLAVIAASLMTKVPVWLI